MVHQWIDVLSAENYEAVFSALGFAMAYQYGCKGPEAIRKAIESYRSQDFYPGVEQFKVTDWRTAVGGNPSPARHIVWYKPNTIGIRGALSFDLPLNGLWSDLQAEFVWFDGGDAHEGYPLSLEDIGFPERWHGE